MLLPTYVFNDSTLARLQTNWKSIIDPVLSNPTTNPTILKNVVLKTGVNTIDHLLGAVQQGWIVSDINAAVTLYRSLPFNNLTLTLVSSGPATVTLVVY